MTKFDVNARAAEIIDSFTALDASKAAVKASLTNSGQDALAAAMQRLNQAVGKAQSVGLSSQEELAAAMARLNASK